MLGVFGLPCSRLEFLLSLPLSFSDVGAGVAILTSLPRSTLLSLSFPLFPPKTLVLASIIKGDVLPDVFGPGGRRRAVSSALTLLDLSTPCPVLGGMGVALVDMSGTGSERSWG